MNITTFFANPTLWGISLAIVFGAVWLLVLAPSGWRNPYLWVMLIAGAILFAPSIAWIQAPLQGIIGNWFVNHFGLVVYNSWLFLMGVPLVLLTGLIQEGAKLLPPVIYWWRKGRNIDLKLGLSLGAMAGVGFGIMEARWVHDTIFASGWSWALVQSSGIIALAGFWERFITVGFHTASSALSGWGLARGRGWQFYLLTSSLHFLLNYSIILLQKHVLTLLGVEVVVTVISLILLGIVFWLRWRKTDITGPEASSVETTHSP